MEIIAFDKKSETFTTVILRRTTRKKTVFIAIKFLKF